VRTYIGHHTRSGESVLDPFGGSGVTAIEAMLMNRRGIHNDINPLANFIASQIADTSHSDVRYIREAFAEVESASRRGLERLNTLSESEVRARLRSAKLPPNIELPRNSDVRNYYDLFTPRQLLALALLMEAIQRVGDSSARGALLLAWSSTLGKLNRTFLSARNRIESRGGSSIFSIYRYKVAAQGVELPPWEVFCERVRNVIAAKEELLKQKRLIERTEGWIGEFECYCLDICALPEVIGHKVDYIFTDPPYGGHIAYLDLSVLWNHWLGFQVPRSARESEVIVGGDLRLTEDHYVRRLRESIRACVSMLKPHRWMSIVFQHWNTRYFQTILEEAASSGASLKAAVTQIGDTIWSMHKKKNKERVLAGEMILTFQNDGQGRSVVRANSARVSIAQLVDEALVEVSPDRRPFAGEILFNRVVMRAWHAGALETLDLTRESFGELLKSKGWQYDRLRHEWQSTVPSNASGMQLTF
jgi:adenine-specific DNA methylase